MEILKSGAKMTMQAVDIGANGGNPEVGPLFAGDPVTQGKRWGGVMIDPQASSLVQYKNVKNIQTVRICVLFTPRRWQKLTLVVLSRQTAEPPTIAGILWDACIPHDLDILKIDVSANL
jgi:hypothetical protein